MQDFLVNYGLITFKLIVAIATALVFLKFFNMNNQLKQMTPLDIIFNFILSAILSNYILDKDISLVEFLMVMIIYAALLYLVSRLTFSTNVGRSIFVGTPKVLIKDGEFDLDMMRRMKVNARDIAIVLRTKNIHSLREVEMAQVEPNGELTVVKKGERDYSVIIIDNGVVDTNGLEKIGRSEKWLMRQLREQKITNIDDVFIAQWYKNKLQIIKKS